MRTTIASAPSSMCDVLTTWPMAWPPSTTASPLRTESAWRTTRVTLISPRCAKYRAPSQTTTASVMRARSLRSMALSIHGIEHSFHVYAKNRQTPRGPRDQMEEKPMSVEERVKSIIVEQLGVDADEVTPEASFVEDLGADSLDTVELIMAFEEEFGVEISDDEAEKIRKVKDAVDYIDKRAKTS